MEQEAQTQVTDQQIQDAHKILETQPEIVLQTKEDVGEETPETVTVH